MYFVHSGVQDESLQVTISKLALGSLTCTRGDFLCAGDIQLTSRFKGWHTYVVSSLQMTLRKACSDTDIFLHHKRGSNLGPLAPEASALTTELPHPQERSTWRSGVRSDMPVASKLHVPRRGPTDVNDALHLHINQKSDNNI